MNKTLDILTRVLTIEDEAAIRLGIVAFLEDSGYEILQATDGKKGLDVFRKEKPDIVLCDLRLPEMDGLDVLSTITQEAPDTPIIIVSGVGLVGDAVQALKRGAWDFVTKPIHDMRILETAIKRALERVELTRQNRIYRETLESLNNDLMAALKQFETDQEAGRKIQFQLLPKDNWTSGGFTFTRRLYPSAYLSGDFVDYAVIDDRHLGFYMADVSGHGAASAFVTVMLKTLTGKYRKSYRQDGDDTILCPDKTLTKLNYDLGRQKLDKHVTIFYGIIDRQTNTLYYSSAGHFPFPVMREGAHARTLACRGFPVALFEDAKFPVEKLSIPDDFILLLLSDGVLEILPQEGNKAKQENLRNMLAEPGVDIDSLVTDLGLDNPIQLPDDVALLMIERHRDSG